MSNSYQSSLTEQPLGNIYFPLSLCGKSFTHFVAKQGKRGRRKRKKKQSRSSKVIAGHWQESKVKARLHPAASQQIAEGAM